MSISSRTFSGHPGLSSLLVVISVSTFFFGSTKHGTGHRGIEKKSPGTAPSTEWCATVRPGGVRCESKHWLKSYSATSRVQSLTPLKYFSNLHGPMDDEDMDIHYSRETLQKFCETPNTKQLKLLYMIDVPETIDPIMLANFVKVSRFPKTYVIHGNDKNTTVLEQYCSEFKIQP